MAKIKVLRLSHRLGRDVRISTHVGLVSRAFGADGIIYSGQRDKKMMESIEMVKNEWGGPFNVKYEKNWKDIIKKFDGVIIHLTMYGIPIENEIEEIRKKTSKKNVLIVVGGEKVPGEIYEEADYNIAITNQPHSEVAALGIFLHEYFHGKYRKFKDAKNEIIPQEHGKKLK
ncbi:MAG: tRNA (cytidine(56)-2'-O)-methyltransferase [Candidatus Aenigmarchaeota archaeon]|nr:tRNA (cytidine(56)-2'-O)-methyltransferase [Candidatus Aenigmarchaeota archaeon]